MSKTVNVSALKKHMEIQQKVKQKLTFESEMMMILLTLF